MNENRDFDMTTDTESRKRENRKLVIVALLGGCVSALSFVLFFLCQQVLVTVLICSIDIVYAHYNASLFFQAKHWKKNKMMLIPLLMIAYWCLVFCAIAVVNAWLLEGVFSNTFFLYPIFLMPAFVLEALIVGLIGMGL